MVEKEARGSPDGASEDGALQDHIAHWVEVLDSWVKRVDVGMGRRTGGTKAEAGNGFDEAMPHLDDGEGSAKGVEV